MQWYFNGAPISGGTNQSLSLVNLSLTNQGNYWLTVSNLVVSVSSSNIYLTVLDTNSPFGDGIPNWWKTNYGLSLTDPNLAREYPTNDLLTYLQKYLYGLNPLTNDTDGDGLSDYEEIFVYGSNPTNACTAGDGIPDGWKARFGLNSAIAIANAEAGFDGVSYIQVYQYDLTNNNLLDPQRPFSVGAGLSNYEIINNGQHTNRFYYDREDRLLGMETSRGVSIAYTYDGNGNPVRQTVLPRASETNGLPVLWSFIHGLTNGTPADGPYGDPDGDGWNNLQEYLAGTDPNDANSRPSLVGNAGASIASLSPPFTPSNFVMGVGQLDGVGAEEIVVGADGNPGTNNNFLLVLTQGATNWAAQQVWVGALGITSIAVGQPANRPAPAIYVGVRQTGGAGAIWELMQTNGSWQTNVLALSTNEAAFVLGVRSGDVLGSFATNGLDGALFSLTRSNGVWSQTVISTNASHRGLGTHGKVFAEHPMDSSLRLLDAGGIEVIGGSTELYTDNILLPAGMVQDPGTRKWHFTTPTAMTFDAASNYFAGFHGYLSLPMSAAENAWFAANFTAPSWIGLYWLSDGIYWYPSYANGTPASWRSGGYVDTYAGYANWGDWDGYSEPHFGPANGPGNPTAATEFNGFNEIDVSGAGMWLIWTASDQLQGIGEPSDPVLIYTNQWLIPEPPATNRFSLRGLSITVGLPRPGRTNSTSIFSAFADDQNLSGRLDAGDEFTLAEYVVSGNGWTTNTLSQIPITAALVAQSFSLAAVDVTGTGSDTLFTGEPDGRIYSWTGADATSPLQRQLFSDTYAGEGWEALCGVQMPAFGEGLVGLDVDPGNLRTCNVILWPPQPVLPTMPPTAFETAPTVAVLPSSDPLGGTAVVTNRVWQAEGAGSALFLQYQILRSGNWRDASILTLDGLPYGPSLLVPASPTGVDHTLVWNARSDLGAGTTTNVLLRARAQDSVLVGDWSLPTPFSVVVPPPPPAFAGVARQPDGGIVINGTGAPGQVYQLLTTTNIALPLSSWTVLTSGSFDSSGAFWYQDSGAITNDVRFYLIMQP